MCLKNKILSILLIFLQYLKIHVILFSLVPENIDKLYNNRRAQYNKYKVIRNLCCNAHNLYSL